MKKIAILCGLVAALLCLTQNANAQYAQIHRDGAGFVDDRGFALSNQEVRDLVGDEIYFDTVVGASKQYRVGGKLIRSGAITLGAGLASALGGAVLLVNSGDLHEYYSGYDQYQRRTYREYDETAEAAGGRLLTGGYVAMFVGGALLEAGIPIRIIGQSRLNWVENNYNDYSRDVSLHVGAAPHGVGLTLRF